MTNGNNGNGMYTNIWEATKHKHFPDFYAALIEEIKVSKVRRDPNKFYAAGLKILKSYEKNTGPTTIRELNSIMPLIAEFMYGPDFGKEVRALSNMPAQANQTETKGLEITTRKDEDPDADLEEALA